MVLQTGPRTAWLEDNLKPDLEKLGFECYLTSGGSDAGSFFIKGKRYYRQKSIALKTKSCASLLREKHRWYDQTGKVVPADVVLSGKALALWLCGDGTVAGNGYRVYFCTDGFSISDVSNLRTLLLATHGIEAHQNKRNRLLICRSESRRRLAALVKPHMPAVFAYKNRFKL